MIFNLLNGQAYDPYPFADSDNPYSRITEDHRPKIMNENLLFSTRAATNLSASTNAAYLNPQQGLGIRLVNKHEASDILGISPETLKKYRLQDGSTLIEGLHYHVWNSRVIRYNPFLIADWGVNRNNPTAHQRTIEAYLKALPSNQPKRGRKAS